MATILIAFVRIDFCRGRRGYCIGPGMAGFWRTGSSHGDDGIIVCGVDVHDEHGNSQTG